MGPMIFLNRVSQVRILPGAPPFTWTDAVHDDHDLCRPVSAHTLSPSGRINPGKATTDGRGRMNGTSARSPQGPRARLFASRPAVLSVKHVVAPVHHHRARSPGRRGSMTGDQLSRFNLRQPPARLLAMICLNIAVRAGTLIVSPWRTATVRAVVL